MRLSEKTGLQTGMVVEALNNVTSSMSYNTQLTLDVIGRIASMATDTDVVSMMQASHEFRKAINVSERSRYKEYGYLVEWMKTMANAMLLQERIALLRDTRNFHQFDRHIDEMLHIMGSTFLVINWELKPENDIHRIVLQGMYNRLKTRYEFESGSKPLAELPRYFGDTNFTSVSNVGFRNGPGHVVNKLITSVISNISDYAWSLNRLLNDMYPWAVQNLAKVSDALEAGSPGMADGKRAALESARALLTKINRIVRLLIVNRFSMLLRVTADDVYAEVMYYDRYTLNDLIDLLLEWSQKTTPFYKKLVRQVIDHHLSIWQRPDEVFYISPEEMAPVLAKVQQYLGNAGGRRRSGRRAARPT